MKQKVICVGQPKTGTTSLGEALRLLGYNVAGWNPLLLDQFGKGEIQGIITAYEQYDAFVDLPWSHPLVFPLLESRDPSAVFIQTIRPEESWIQSVQRHFASTRTPDRYRIVDFEKKATGLVSQYIERNIQVRKYLSEKNRKILVIDISKGDTWSELQAFLGLHLNAETMSFPHLNRGEQ